MAFPEHCRGCPANVVEKSVISSKPISLNKLISKRGTKCNGFVTQAEFSELTAQF